MKISLQLGFVLTFGALALNACNAPPPERPTNATKSNQGAVSDNSSNQTVASNGTSTNDTTSTTNPNGTTGGSTATDMSGTGAQPGNTTTGGTSTGGTGTTTTDMTTVKEVELVGGIDTSSSFYRLGQLNGWAGNKKATGDFLDVNFYIDGDNKSGTKIGTTKANLVGVDGDVDGDHAFVYVISTGPAADGKHHKLYAYAVVNGGEQILDASYPLDLVVLKPKGGAAEAIYNKIGFNGYCKGCHSFDYAERWDGLARAGDDKKWTATDNYLYNKVHNHRVKFDGGSTVCDKIDCDQVAAWWTAEFGGN